MDDTDICNMALAHLGHSVEIAAGAVLNERSKHAAACRRFLEPVRKEVLRDHEWQFARGFVELNLIEEDPTNEWDYSYRVPEDAVKIRRLFADAGRLQGQKNRPSFLLTSDLYSTTFDMATTYAENDYAQSGSVWYRALRETIGDPPPASPSDWVAITGSPPAVIYTDKEDATCEYTRLITDVNLYPPDFLEAMSLLLAAYIAPRLTGDNTDLAAAALQKYAWRWGTAKKNDGNEQQTDPDPDSDFISSRN